MLEIKENVQNVKIVGVKTYGKGVVQGLFTLPDQSGLKLTIEEYFTNKPDPGLETLT